MTLLPHRPTIARRASRLALALLLLVAAAMAAAPAGAELRPRGEPGVVGGVGTVTGLPIPRFVSLGSDKVNLRVGPGLRYPIAWVYVRRGLPVEVVAEFELYRKIRDTDGTEGWVHRNLLSGRRTVLVTGGLRSLHRRADAGSPPVALVEAGVQARLLACRGDWCRIEAGGWRGHVQRTWIWGVYPHEDFD